MNPTLSRIERPLTPGELERFAALLFEPDGAPAALLQDRPFVERPRVWSVDR